jgi:hypothetical protein
MRKRAHRIPWPRETPFHLLNSGLISTNKKDLDHYEEFRLAVTEFVLTTSGMHVRYHFDMQASS